MIISQKSNAFGSSHSDQSDIGVIYITFLEKTSLGQSILTLHKAFKITLFTVILLLRRNTSLLPIRRWIAAEKENNSKFGLCKLKTGWRRMSDGEWGAYFRPDFAAIGRKKFAARYFWFKAKLEQKTFIFK